MIADYRAAFSISEEWRPVVGFPGYEVSNRGNVRSLERAVWRSGYAVRLNAKPLCGWIKRRGGLVMARIVALRRDSLTFEERVHRLVLTAFVGPCPDGMEGCHNNGNPLDNDLCNLRWDTHAENVADSVRHGTKIDPPRLLGSAHPNAKMTEEIAEKIRAVKEWPHGSVTSMARQLGISARMVDCVRKGQTWRDMP